MQHIQLSALDDLLWVYIYVIFNVSIRLMFCFHFVLSIEFKYLNTVANKNANKQTVIHLKMECLRRKYLVVVGRYFISIMR